MPPTLPARARHRCSAPTLSPWSLRQLSGVRGGRGPDQGLVGSVEGLAACVAGREGAFGRGTVARKASLEMVLPTGHVVPLACLATWRLLAPSQQAVPEPTCARCVAQLQGGIACPRGSQRVRLRASCFAARCGDCNHRPTTRPQAKGKRGAPISPKPSETLGVFLLSRKGLFLDNGPSSFGKPEILLRRRFPPLRCPR